VDLNPLNSGRSNPAPLRRPAGGFAPLIGAEGQFVTPTIIGRQLELNALAVLLSLASWTRLLRSDGRGPFFVDPYGGPDLKQRLYGNEAH
jgi:hypothetical protein